MPVGELPIEQFGGLNIVQDPGEVAANGAVDLQDVDFDQLGRVKSRQGFVKYTLSEGVNPYDSLHTFRRASGADTLVAGAGARLEAITDGAVALTATSAASPHYFASFGTATESRVYIANGTDTVRYYEGASFTTPSYTGTTPTGRFLATQQPDNRLVVARTAANRSRVMFSDPGDPHTFQADNYVDLSPGDGEEITALVTWRDFVFAFKETKYFVFYGNDVDTTGAPVFNNRAVYGAGVRLGRSAVAGADGVYFLDRRGVYRSSGGQASLISRSVEPLFAPISDTSNDRIDGSSRAVPVMHWADDRLYLSYSTTGTANDRVLVYHCTDDWWSVWNVAASSMCTAQTEQDNPLQEALLFGYSSGLKHIGQFTDAITDDGSPIDSVYQLGYLDGGDSTQKRLLEVLVDGNGRVRVEVGTDYESPRADLAQDLVLTSGSATGRRRARVGRAGHNFSIRLSSVDGSSWKANRLVCGFRSKRPLGVESDT